jgi:Predicted membrane protein (DUF2157)
MKLDKKLATWCEANLLTAEQTRAILAYERLRGGSVNWIVLALGAVGALAVVAGLISLIAANWDAIPAPLKLAAAFTMLVGALAAAHRLSHEEKTLASDLLLAAHAGLVLATIGLVGQVYHLSGAAWRPLALAAAMALPAAVISDRSILSDIAIGYALVALGLFASESRDLRPYLDGFGWALFAASVGGALLLLADGLQRRHPAAMRALRRWGAALLFAVAILAATAWSAAWAGRTQRPFVVLCSILAVAWVVRLAWSRKGALALAALALSALVLGAAGIGGRFPGGSWHPLDAGTRFLGFALFCVAGAAFAVAAAKAGSRRLTNLFTLAIAGRIVVLFLEVLSTLAMTGFGLLVTGAAFCAVAWAWWRLHTVLPVNEAEP